MDGSYITQIFPLRKLGALAHTVHANIHTYIHTIYTRKTWSALICGKACRKKNALSWTSKTYRVGRFHKVAGSEFQTDGVMKLKGRFQTGFRLLLEIFKSFSLTYPRVCRKWIFTFSKMTLVTVQLTDTWRHPSLW